MTTLSLLSLVLYSAEAHFQSFIMSDAFRDVENPPSTSVSGGQHSHEFDSSRSVPDTLQNFLSQVGVVNAPTESTASLPGVVDYNSSLQQPVFSSPSSTTGNNEESIFESYFDLTEERLRYVFSMFDTDEDGRISYENLRQGIRFHVAGLEESDGSLLDDASFQYLVEHLDLDHSGDVSFEEFSEGLRLLILRSLLKQEQHVKDKRNLATVQLFDYDAVRFEKHRVVQSRLAVGDAGESTSQQQLVETEIAARDFYFRSRPDWVKTRWINVAPNGSRTAAAMTMNRLAIKYLLHPLALEDALSPEIHRPKAELYSNHYFIMAPVFYIEWEPVKVYNTKSTSSSVQRLSCALPRFLRWLIGGCPPRSSGRRNAGYEDNNRTAQVSKICSQMVSIFVNVPKDDTIITFTSGVTKRTRLSTVEKDDVSDSSHHLWERVQRELEKSYSKLRQYDAQYLTYALLDEAVDLVDPIMKTMKEEIDRERDVLEREKFRNLARIRHLKDQLERVGRKFKPFLRLLTHVIEDDAISPGATVYLRDVLDNLECSDEELRQLITECESLDSEADKVQSRQMDLTLYTLTVISAVFLPAQFLTGVWGMNFEHMPELDESWGYKMFWAISAFLIITLIILLNFGRLR